MRILLCPCDRQGCGRYRIGLPAAALQKQETSLEIYLSEGLPVRINVATGRAIGLADGSFDWDVVVVQRPMSDWQVQSLRDCRKRGIRTVVEVDDDFEALHPLAPAWVSTHPNVSEQWNRNWLRVACREADLVTVTTPALAARYAPHGRVAILGNYVPESWLSIEADRFGDILGWAGTIGTHQGDLGVTRGGVAQAVRETGALFRVIGRPELVKRDLGLDREPDNVPWKDWEDYPAEVAKLDAAIAPLADTGFNRAKSSLKLLESSALGVPCVVSPLPSYVDLHRRLGVGILAKNRTRDWCRETRRLFDDDDYRLELGSSSREAVRGETIEANCWRWAEAWTDKKTTRLASRLLT